jgi:hypothetical protein
MSAWRPGFVNGLRQGEVRLVAGQVWGFFPTGNLSDVVLLRVVSLSPDGMVVLRPDNAKDVDRLWPLKETVFKGKTILTREGCPFQWVTLEAAKGAKGAYEYGDLLTHEGWSMWERHMRASVEVDLPVVGA